MTASTGPADIRAPVEASAGGDADLARRAAGGEQAAFEELYRRHVPIAWRLAQSVAPGSEEAQQATQNAFIRVLKIVRRGRPAAAEQFGPYLLAAVYRDAVQWSPGESPSGGSTTRPLAAGLAADLPDAELLGRAFRSLPERWRAAEWLTDVEHLPIGVVAPILGESAAVTTQLVARARTSLANRFFQFGRQRDLPDVPATLRAASFAQPAGLAGATLAAWHKPMATERDRVGPVAGWLKDRAPRQLAFGIAGLLALGLIGLGVLGQRGVLGGSRQGGPLAAPQGSHDFSFTGPPSASLRLAGAGSPLAPTGGIVGAGFLNPTGSTTATGSNSSSASPAGPGTSGGGPGTTAGGPGTTSGQPGGSTTLPTIVSTIPTTRPTIPTTRLTIPTTLPTIPTTLPTIPTTITLPTIPTTITLPTIPTTITLPTIP